MDADKNKATNKTNILPGDNAPGSRNVINKERIEINKASIIKINVPPINFTSAKKKINQLTVDNPNQLPVLFLAEVEETKEVTEKEVTPKAKPAPKKL